MDKTSGGAQPDQRRQLLGLRERKKRETAECIYRTALKLFRELNGWYKVFHREKDQAS